MPKIGEIYTSGSDKSHLSLPTCTKFASQLFLSNFYCTTTTTTNGTSSRKSSSFNSKVSGDYNVQLGQTTACSGLQEKLCGMPWLKMMILPLMFAFGGKNILLLRIKFANFMFIYATNHYGPFLFEYPKISYLACPHALQIQITFYPFIMI